MRLAYVANDSSNDVTVIDTKTQNIIDTVSLPTCVDFPVGMAINSYGNYVYISEGN
ncbi:hypothetical protein [Bacillus sp. SM2101]|uniref:hypothetical protein n=1 Tax=Bacillaceae TaxID=186817 RepID=UPI001BDF232C|nr:hypothetical protein [Bacillus sp. SM2101]